jgi:hypothetical protein
MRFTEQQRAAFAAAVEGNFESQLAARVAKAFGGDPLERTRRLVAEAKQHGIVTRRALSAYVALDWLSGNERTPAGDADVPRDVRVLEALDAALIGRSSAERARVASLLDRSHLPHGETVPPRALLDGLQPAPRGPNEPFGAPVILARGRDDALDNHWIAAISSDIVFIEAFTHPGDESVWSQIGWMGGAPIDGHPHWRRVPRDRPARHRIVATLGRQCAVLHLWVVALERNALVPADAEQWVPSARALVTPREPPDWGADFERRRVTRR